MSRVTSFWFEVSWLLPDIYVQNNSGLLMVTWCRNAVVKLASDRSRQGNSELTTPDKVFYINHTLDELRDTFSNYISNILVEMA